MEFNGTDKGYDMGTVRNSAKECHEEPGGNLLGPNDNGKGTISRSGRHRRNHSHSTDCLKCSRVWGLVGGYNVGFGVWLAVAT